MRLIFNKNSFIYYNFMFFYILLSTVYFYIFAYDISDYVDSEGFFQRALNMHDHLVYFNNFNLIKDNRVVLALNNDFGIAYLYYIFSYFYPIDETNIAYISYLFNLCIFNLCAYLYFKITTNLQLKLSSKIIFFAGFQFFYFMQLINKDMLNIFILLLLIHLIMKGYIYKLLVLIPFVALVRLQLVFLIFIILFLLIFKKRYFLTLFIIYVITSIFSAYLSSKLNFIGEDSLEGGFSAFIFYINSSYFYMGNLIFNPFRILQFFQDIFLSFKFFTNDNGVDMAKILRLPLLLICIYYIKYIFYYIRDYAFWIKTKIAPVQVMIISYVILLLMNPTINARYVMLIMPIWLLFVFYSKKNYKRSTHE